MFREPAEIVEETCIPGLHWERTYRIPTSKSSRSSILVQSPGQGNVSVVYHAEDFTASDHKGYDVYGIHVGQVDVLTFLADGDHKIVGHFVDCRHGSSTLHHETTLEIYGDPERALVIDRGIAHIFDNLVGMVTLNQPRLFLDLANPDFNRVVDVLNVPRGASNFPTLRVNRYRTPAWLCRFTRKMQRLQLRANPHSAYPFRFATREGNITLLPREKGKP